MRRIDVLTPAWFVLVAVVSVLGAILARAIDVYVFADGERFRWSGVVFFAVSMFVLQVGLVLWRRRQRRAQGLS